MMLVASNRNPKIFEKNQFYHNVLDLHNSDNDGMVEHCKDRLNQIKWINMATVCIYQLFTAPAEGVLQIVPKRIFAKILGHLKSMRGSPAPPDLPNGQIMDLTMEYSSNI